MWGNTLRKGPAQRLLPLLVTAAAGLALPAEVAANAAPVVDDLAASSPTVLPGGTVTLDAEAHDPDCPGTCTSGCGLYVRSDLTHWAATGGTFPTIDNGTSGSPYSATAVWEAPATEGVYTLTLTLSDSGSFLCGGRQQTSATLDLLVTTSTNRPPVVESLTADPSVVFPAEESSLACVASDPEGDPLTYGWQTDLGTVTPGTGGTATFVSVQPGIATVTCTATDPQGFSGSDSTTISVQGAQAEGTLVGGLQAPQRLAVDAFGNAYAVDDGQGLAVLHIEGGELVYRLPLPGLAAVAVDWNGDLLLGGELGVQLRSRVGEPLRALAPPGPDVEVADVVADADRHLWAALYRRNGRVVVWNEQGEVVAGFGSTGDGPEQFRSPHGLAVTPSGHWIVADTGHGLLKVFDDAGALVDSFGGLGGGVGEFVQLDDVAVGPTGLVYASDSFQDWIQVFEADGSPRETVGSYGTGPGQFRTAAGLALAPGLERLVAASLNGPSLQVFRTDSDPPAPPGPPVGVVSPSSLQFGSQPVGVVSPWQTVVLENQGERPLGVLAFRAPADFRVGHECPPFLEPGASCAAQVVFAPSGPGPCGGALQVAVSWGGPLAVSLSGEGVVPSGLLLEPPSIFFPDQAVGTVSGERVVALSNTGSSVVTLGAVTTTGDFLVRTACPPRLPGGASCDLLVSFAPRSVDDELLGEVVVQSDAVGSPHRAALGGAGVGGDLSISVADVEADEAAGTVSFSLRLSRSTQQPVTVSYATAPDDAGEGDDYLPVAGVAEFAGGVTEVPVEVTILDDDLLEPETERFWLQLFEASGAALLDASAAGTIVDDELCVGPNLVANPGAEEAGPNNVPGWQSPHPSMTWGVRGAPPQPVEGDLFFYAGDAEHAEIFQDVDLAAFGSAIDAREAGFAFMAWVRSGEETPPDPVRIVVEYRDASLEGVLGSFDSGELAEVGAWRELSHVGAAPPGTRWARIRLLAERRSGDLTDAMVDAVVLTSHRVATVAIRDGGALEGDVGTTPMTFAVDLSCPYGRAVELDFQTLDGTAKAGRDYLEAAGRVTIEPGDPGAAIDVQVIGDDRREQDEQLQLAATLLAPAEAVLLRAEAVGTILDDDGCARGAEWWLRDPTLLPDRMELSGRSWTSPELAEALEPAPWDAFAELRRQIVAARLNFLAGAPSEVLPTVLAAERVLDRPSGGPAADPGLERLAVELAVELAAYNEGPCGSPVATGPTEGRR